MAYVNLSKMPNPRQEYTVNFGNINGGLNLSELEYRLKNNESPSMKNLMWREGVLCSRDGQDWVGNLKAHEGNYGKAMYPELFHGFIVAHLSFKGSGGTYTDGLYYCDPTDDTPTWTMLYVTVGEGAEESKSGAFFVYYGKLYYKAPGQYIVIEYRSLTDTLEADAVEGYVPITLINADPATAAGDLYQPENRLSSKKTVWYNAASGVTEYYLPVRATSVTKVVVDGNEVTADTNPPAAGKYYYDSTNGKVIFGTAPPVTTPATNNTVQITYSLANNDAYNSVMDCAFAATYGGTGNLCVVMGGCPAQPNAIFWNTIGYGAAMDPSYFPMEQYQFCGDTDDMITGFGKQQSFLVVFKEHSIGRVKQDTQTVDDRLTIDMPYVAINDKIGCDLPGSIQLIENNLVWCNLEQGVHILKDSSYAYENNIECVSKKINGGQTKRGMLASVRTAQHVSSLDDSKRYWLCCDGECWVWDYEYTAYKDPSWYYMTNINAVAFASHYDQVWHIGPQGGLTQFVRSYYDYSYTGEDGKTTYGAIDKVYRFATQYFGGYDRYKNVNSIIIVTLPETNATSQLKYITDYEERWDLSPLVHLVWGLAIRDLTYRSLAGIGYGAAFRRKPMCRRIHHFAMELRNNVPGQDLNIVSAQVFYNYQGRLR